MTDPEEYKKPDIASTRIYPQLARATLFDLHENGLEMITAQLQSNQGPKNFVIVGPGKEVVPFSERLDTVVRMLQGGNLILMDYNSDICDDIPEYLQMMGFAGQFNIQRQEGNFNPRQTKNTVFVVERDIRAGYPIPDGSADGIDMTVSVHHVTQYESDIEAMALDARAALRPGGFLHVGEGDVDMKYSERKIKRIAKDLGEITERDISIIDGRDTNKTRGLSFKGKDGLFSMHIDSNSMVTVAHAGEYLEKMQKKGYKQIFTHDGSLIMPLIDHCMEEDYQGMIVPVREYYRKITEVTLPRLAEEHHPAFNDAIRKERSDAMRGLVEFYSPPTMVCDNLRKAGFLVGERRYTKHGPFVNILAHKTE